MADPYSNQILTATEEEKKRRLQDAEARAAATEQANQAYIGNLETAQAANQAALDQSQQNYNNLMAKYNNDFAAMVQGESDRIRKEQEEARTMIQADQKAAQWSGLTELASSVANMIGVGSFNAANQQYRSYSQDWMKKADQDLREHRYRMDNVRARQNALKQQQLNLQMGQAGQALARENERIKQQYNDRMALAEAQRNAALQPMDIRSKAADEAGELGLKGMQTAAGIKAQEQSTAQGWSRIKAQDEANELSRLTQGFVRDENGDWKYDPEKAASKLGVTDIKKISKSGGKDGDDFPVIDKDGKVNVAHLTNAERENVYTQARSSIQQDLGEEDAKEFRKDWLQAADDKASNAVLQKWMGKSKTMEEYIRSIDEGYAGIHYDRPEEEGQQQPPQEPKKGILSRYK